MKENNLPPFYVGQKVVLLVDSINVKKGDVFTVLRCFKHCCVWLVDVGLLSPVYANLGCTKCEAVLRLEKGKPLCPESCCFAPIESQFQSISFKEVVEIESPLISVQ